MILLKITSVIVAWALNILQLSVWSLVIVANAVNILQLSVKYRRMVSITMDVDICGILLHILFVLPIYPPV
jgi:hypothetical protein